MVKNRTLSKYLVTPALESGGQMWSLDFLSRSCRVTACKRCFVLTVLFSSAVLQVRRTVCSSGLGYLVNIHPLHHSPHSVEVTMRTFVPVLCLSEVGCFIPHVITWDRLSKQFSVLTVTVFTRRLKYVVKESAYVIVHVSLHAGLVSG